MIEVRDLSVAYGEFSLEEISLELGAGHCLAILGPSGAGKSLLLESVMGARRPRSGSVLLAGRNVTDLPPEERRIAYIPQDLALFPHLSVAENIVFGLASRRARAEREGPLARTAALLGITHLLNRPDVKTLSGGERQRVALARALIVQPRVLFLDEPFAGLDPQTRAEMLRVVRDLRHRVEMTIFLVTHDLDEACLLADEVAILMQGRVRRSGSLEAVLRSPRSLEVARFLNYRNFLAPASLPPELLERVAGLAADTVALAIRPEEVRLEPSAPPGSCLLSARLIELVPLSGRTLARLELAGGTPLEALLSQRAARAWALSLNRELGVRLTPEALVPLSAGAAHAPGPARKP